VDTERDGGWHVPKEAWLRMRSFLKQEGIHRLDWGKYDFTAKKIPLDRIDEIVRGVSYILMDYQCSHML
jgi:hypothetical protein